MNLAHILKSDKLGQVITSLIKEYQPVHILEIGSSDGTGSTRVICDAARGTGAQVYCIEMEDDRFYLLKRNTSDYGFVYPYNAASVGTYGMIDRDYIDKFRTMRPNDELWKVMSLKEIYAWYDNTARQIPEKMISDGIHHIKKEHGIKHFDMVLIDGSPFTAMEELMQVYGAGLIVLDDTQDLKCYDCLMMMLNDNQYTCIDRDDNYRNGYAVFKKN